MQLFLLQILEYKVGKNFLCALLAAEKHGLSKHCFSFYFVVFVGLLSFVIL